MSKLIRSFAAALNGLRIAFQSERNLKIHVVAFLTVILTGFYFTITSGEWLAIFLISALVFSLELVNTSFERICDFIEPNQNEKIKIIKDTAAAAVLVAAAFAFLIALLIFIPYFFTQL
jgi:undecaprenol kinase/diacylglycerol kinase (ATP)